MVQLLLLIISLCSLFVALFFSSGVASTTFMISNKCDFTVWPGITSSSIKGSTALSSTDFVLQKGENRTVIQPASWSGRFWGRTGCANNSTGKFSCLTGDCRTGNIECNNTSGSAPITLVEFTLDSGNGNDFFDISLVDGYNLPVLVVPQGGAGQNCLSVGCVLDLKGACPPELKVTSKSGEVIACKSPCDAFQESQYCCTGEHSSPDTCKPTNYSKIFKNACPDAYSYAYDDKTRTFTCTSSVYQITFCPSPTTRLQNVAPSASPSPLQSVSPPFTKNTRKEDKNVAPSASPSPLPSVSPPFTKNTRKEDKRNLDVRTIVLGIVSTVIFVALASLTCAYFYYRKQKKRTKSKLNSEDLDENSSTVGSLQLSYETILLATDNFSQNNKLGQGGFGSVYKGILPNGQQVAVKRLLRNSKQGEAQFENEAKLMARLQHRNLVRFLDFCFEENERLLVYEFVPNSSLDHFIFDGRRRFLMDWKTRLKIIVGIARGLLYLHEDSQLRIVHRDLKLGNILLDEFMNPKIADFGTARLFAIDQSQDATTKVMGTLGYMAPESVRGIVSVKLDVFSFGVLVLEIISGQKITNFRDEEERDLINYAWNNWNKGSVSNIIDPVLMEAASRTEILRCIHIAFLCLQEDAWKRPTMASVILMLDSNTFVLAKPSKPAYLMHSYMEQNTSSSQELTPAGVSQSNPDQFSVNEVSITELVPR